MPGRKYAQKLFWIDIESSGLPKGNDWSGVSVLEVACIVTDFALNPEAGYEEVVKLTQKAADELRGNPEVLEMHKKNGLLQRAAKEATMTMAEVEQEMIGLLKDTGLDKGEFMIAGSGVAAFDHPLMKSLMPELASWLAYYPFDIGVLRRTLRILNGNKDLVPAVKASYGPDKSHRAMDDVKAHLEESVLYQRYFKVPGSEQDPWS